MTRCALCPGTNACIPPDGPMDADIVFIGEAPGFQENQNALKHFPGKPFIGSSGKEVDQHYLPLAGLRRHRVIFANTISCLPTSAGGKLDPKRRQDVALAQCCFAHHLRPLIERVRPQLIVTLGAFARIGMAMEGTLDHDHGIPQEAPDGRVVFPMYHPALGIYEPKKMLLIRNDWIRLKKFLVGTLDLHVDDVETDYQEVEDGEELDRLDPSQPLACDTESKRGGEPFCFTYSQNAGAGRLIRASRWDLLLRLNRYLQEWKAPILWHNWFYDWTVTEAMGLTFPFRKIVDTMASVYRLGNLPQGLKALAFRELGMEMQDFEDLVIPYSREHVLNYYRIAQTCDFPKPDEELKIDDKTGQWKLYRPQGMSTKLKRFFTDYEKNPDKDVFLTWDNWEASQAMIEAEIGPWPGMCISHVPFEKTLHYACRDADALIRLWPVLQQMKARVRKYPQHEWRM